MRVELKPLLVALVVVGVIMGAAASFSHAASADICSGDYPNCATYCALTGENCDAASDGGVDYGWICASTGNDCPAGGSVYGGDLVELPDGSVWAWDGSTYEHITSDQPVTLANGVNFQLQPCWNDQWSTWCGAVHKNSLGEAETLHAPDPPDCDAVAVIAGAFGQVIWGAEANCNSKAGMKKVSMEFCLHRTADGGSSWVERSCEEVTSFGGHSRPDLLFYNCGYTTYRYEFSVTAVGIGTDNNGESAEFAAQSIILDPFNFDFGCQ